MIALVTGGASSGKSAFAEQLALSLPGPHVYAATMRHGDAETEARIERHRAMRAGKGFVTVELAKGSWTSQLDKHIDDFSEPGVTAEIACSTDGHVSTLGALAASASATTEEAAVSARGALARKSDPVQMDGESALPLVAGTVLLEDLSNLVVNECASQLPAVLASDNAVVVANEIGADGARYDDFTCGFIDQLGALACGIAARADVVVEVVAGVPRVVKGALPSGVGISLREDCCYELV